jgi:hypothetical protein
MPTAAQAAGTIQKYQVYIEATPQAIWDAITNKSGQRNTAMHRSSNTS